MKSKRDFTLEEVYKIKELIRLKLQASSEEQKKIRAKIQDTRYWFLLGRLSSKNRNTESGV